MHDVSVLIVEEARVARGERPGPADADVWGPLTGSQRWNVFASSSCFRFLPFIVSAKVGGGTYVINQPSKQKVQAVSKKQ